ncbi:DUF6460 domain-containing protein [Devosia sp. FJ2-5-3]|jgi:hypothetical protein|uniref:DUF6460 domain-containing protein n=1 Tax=Devosia sp. FJ2-5-3 TaxID=2976680 RepID=UPI0023D82896|nr:DUF6460 domain-containing protein [Devosia sp. FJ2-5-3]WEJ59073.1 DUF6460 domain-containing protein [Devosia sp. FJ2-5-3]
MTEDYRPEERSPLEKLMGGRPVWVVVKLALVSLFVGFVMSVFGFNALDLVNGAVDLVRDAFRDGAGIFRQMGAYVLAGAALVVPIWLLMRLSRRR